MAEYVVTSYKISNEKVLGKDIISNLELENLIKSDISLSNLRQNLDSDSHDAKTFSEEVTTKKSSELKR